MKKLFLAAVAALAFMAAAPAMSDTYVRGYTKKNGTYVAPHWRSSPDRSYNNNWSVSPNINPYTGKRGTRAPTWNDQAPSGGLDGGPGLFGNSTKPRGNPYYK